MTFISVTFPVRKNPVKIRNRENVNNLLMILLCDARIVRLPSPPPKIKHHPSGWCFIFGLRSLWSLRPKGNRACSGEMNPPCAKVLLRKTLVTPHKRRSTAPALRWESNHSDANWLPDSPPTAKKHHPTGGVFSVFLPHSTKAWGPVAARAGGTVQRWVVTAPPSTRCRAKPALPS